MAMELKHLNPQHVMDVTGKAIDEISRLRAENAELKAENERLNNALDKERSETIKCMDELCNAKNEIERLTIDKRNAELRADVADATAEKLKAENECLKQKLEDAKATAYTDSVDAGMRERRLKRALWLTRARPAYLEFQLFVKDSVHTTDSSEADHAERMAIKWHDVKRKCQAKGEEYK